MHKIIVMLVAILSQFLTACSTPQKSPSGFIDKSGAVIVSLDELEKKPLAIGNFSEGVAPIKTIQGLGFLNKSGEIVFTRPYQGLGPVIGGLAAFEDADRWGFIDKTGAIKIVPNFLGAHDFSADIAAVKVEKGWTFINKEGKQLFQLTFEDVGDFKDGFAPVKLNGHWGFIDTTGTFVVPARFDIAYASGGGKLVAANGTGLSGDNPDQTVFYFDNLGRLMRKSEFKGITLNNLRPKMWVRYLTTETPKEPEKLNRALSRAVSPAYFDDKSIGQADTKFCINEQFAAPAFTGNYDYIFPVKEGYFVVYDDTTGLFDYRGGKPEAESGIWNSKEFRFYQAAPFSEGLGLVQTEKAGPYGFVDKSGKFVLKPIYKYARPFKDGLALVAENEIPPVKENEE